MLKQNPACIVITDPAGNIVYVNPRFVELTGYGIEEVQGKNPHILNAGLESNSGNGSLWPTIRSGKTWDGVFCNRKKNGEIYWESARIAPVFDASGAISNYIAVKEDISARVRAEQRLAAQASQISRANAEFQRVNANLHDTIARLELSEYRFRRTMEQIPGYIYVHEYLHGRPIFSYHSLGCLALTGYSPEEYLADPELWFSIIVPDDRELMLQYIEQVHAGRTNQALEYRINHKQGGIVWIQNFYAADMDEAGRLLRVQGFQLDLTDRIALEHDLLEAKAQAEQANQAKSAFLAAMSHELRTPLNAVLGFSQLLAMNQENNLLPAQLDFLASIRSSGSHLLEMINDVLDLSKIEAGRQELVREPVGLAELAKELVASFRSLAAERQLEIRLEMEACPGSLLADKKKLRQILYNLLSNAIKFTTPGKIVGLSVGHTAELACIAVWDEGIGIAPEDQERVFNPFEQVRSAQRQNQGTGLGLSITQQLVQLHGGTIKLESTLGRGSRFTVFLPGYQSGSSVSAAECPDAVVVEPLAMPPIGEEIAATGSPTMARPEILVVEDSEINQRLVKAYLDKLGYGYEVAGDAESAWPLLTDRHFALGLFDINLPGMDGAELARRCRRLEQLRAPGTEQKSMILVALTAHAMEEDRKRFLLEGFNAVLTKPLDFTVLEATLRDWLGKDAGRTAPPAQPDPRAVDPPAVQVPELDSLARELQLPLEFLRELIATFFDTVWQQYRTVLADAIESGSYPAIQQQAHKLKGAVANLRFASAAELFSRMEGLAKTATAADYRAMLDQAGLMLQDIRNRLQI